MNERCFGLGIFTKSSFERGMQREKEVGGNEIGVRSLLNGQRACPDNTAASSQLRDLAGRFYRTKSSFRLFLRRYIIQQVIL